MNVKVQETPVAQSDYTFPETNISTGKLALLSGYIAAWVSQVKKTSLMPFSGIIHS